MENIEVVETTEVKENKFKAMTKMIGAGVKKHGKKVAGLAALAGVGILGYILGSKNSSSDEYVDDEIDSDEESVEIDDEEI